MTMVEAPARPRVVPAGPSPVRHVRTVVLLVCAALPFALGCVIGWVARLCAPVILFLWASFAEGWAYATRTGDRHGAP